MLFGIDCLFSSSVLAGMLELDVSMVGLCLPGPPSFAGLLPAMPQRKTLNLVSTPGTEQASILQLASEHGVPAYRAGNLRDRRTIDALGSLEADLLICACFTRLVPRRLYEQIPLGGLNLHPSLLPDKRGPDPAFWTFKEGLGESGMTIHRLSRRFDAGEILAQKPIELPDGISEDEFDRRTSREAVDMLAGLLPKLVAGSAPAHLQDESQATHAPRPTADDYVIDRSRPARAAFNFVRGLAGRGQPIWTEHGGARVRVVEALSYVHDPGDAVEQSYPVDAALLECNPGILIARVEPYATH